MKVSTRMRWLVGLSLAGLLALWLTALFIVKGNLMDDRKEQTRRLVSVGIGVLEHFHKLATTGRMSDDEARKAAKETLRGMRYGQNDYYFIFTGEHVYVLYPTKPEFEGVNKADMQDSNGKYLVRELVATAKAGGGFVDYAFPRAGQTTAEPKLSYAAYFEPWGWIIGTGIYIDDVDKEYDRIAMVLGVISVLLLVAMGIMGARISGSIIRQLGGEPAVARAAMQQMAGGNLVVSVGNPPPDSLLGSLQAMATALRELVSGIEGEAGTLVVHSGKITQAAEGISKAAEEESESTSAIAAAVEELTVSSSHILDIAKETETNSQEAMRLAVHGSQRVGEARASMKVIAQTVSDASDRIGVLESRASEISSIAGVIKEIAAQTNLLALNAAIEAARAGEQGRGFAVVADEVRKLAERTTTATTSIESMIASIQVETGGAVTAMRDTLPVVRQGVEVAESASESLHAIETGAQAALDRVHDVANATREQSAASTSIAQQVEDIARMVEQTSNALRANAETAVNLESVAQTLRAHVARFRT